MIVATDFCILCGNQGCSVCRKKKFLNSYEANKKPNAYGCYCTDNQYCKTCKIRKIEEKGLSPEYIRLLNLYLELKDNEHGIMTTGRVEDDNKILELFGQF